MLTFAHEGAFARASGLARQRLRYDLGMTCFSRAWVVGFALLAACGSTHGTDAGPDGGEVMDSGSRDAGAADAGSTDAGAGDDGGGIDAGTGDAGTGDAGTPGTCDAMDARRDPCPEVLCDGPDQWYWNGDGCFVLDCGSCTGDDCDRGVFSEAECIAAHATCEPTLCRDTGGEWMWWAQECGHRQCGQPAPETCLVPFAGCDCGPMANFVPGVGCQNDVACTMGPMPTREELCTGSGGSWEGICCDTVCGEFCPLPCVNDACNCGPGRVFVDGRGCLLATECFERTNGQSCVMGQSRCEDGTICCDRCGGAGCANDPRCVPPTCSDDPNIDECGNNLLAP